MRDWYEIHAPVWHLPAIDSALQDELEMFCHTLGRIPQRDTLLALIEALRSRQAERVKRETKEAEWRELNGHLENSAPARLDQAAQFSRLESAESMALFERLARELAPSDYRLVVRDHWDDDIVVEGLAAAPPAPRGTRAGADPYGNTSAFVRRFEDWYEAYRSELALPDLDAAILRNLESRFIAPLDDIPRPAALRQLIAAYDPVHRQLLRDPDGEPDWRGCLVRLRETWPPLLWRTLIYSREWRGRAEGYELIEAVR